MAKSNKSLVLLFGEMGNGKSTSGNVIMKEELRRKGHKFKSSKGFHAGKSSKAVTTKMHVKSLESISIVDTPGLNDPDQKRSDAQIFINIVKNMQSE